MGPEFRFPSGRVTNQWLNYVFVSQRQCPMMVCSSDQSSDSGAEVPLAAPLETLRPKESQVTLEWTALEELIETSVKEICGVLSIKKEVARCLLFAYAWHGDDLVNDWFSHQSMVLEKARINVQFIAPMSPVKEVSTAETFTCPILAIDVPNEESWALDCGHRYSHLCWKQYLECSLDDGPESVLRKRCPAPDCLAMVTDEVWDSVLDERGKTRRRRFAVELYVRGHANTRWCPSPPCDRVVITSDASPGTVACNCGQSLCGSCGDETHAPAACSIVSQWKAKNADEADNVSWILVNTKTCPGCRRPIEKDHGCLHMRCPCGREFCWLCGADWSRHTSSQLYRCNKYEERTVNEGEAQQKEAAVALERYTHFFERFRAHNHGQAVATKRRQGEIAKAAGALEKQLGDPAGAAFLRDATECVIDCRRVLKWSYVLAYFSEWSNESEKNIFEDQQGQLERHLDALQELIESFTKQVDVTEKWDAAAFSALQENIVQLSAVVRHFFSNISCTFKDLQAKAQVRVAFEALGSRSGSGRSVTLKTR